MKTRILAALGIAAFALLPSCNDDLITYTKQDIQISIEKGDGWLHDFPLFLGIKKKNPPQIAIWTEDMEGNYLTTIYATRKIATGAFSGGNRRKEALPAWCYARGVQYPDGLYLPTKDAPLTDGISGATPHDSFDVKISPTDPLKRFVVKIELNHSTDWNDNYPKDAKEGEANYSGGKEGSGQPAVVYAAVIDPASSQKQYTATLAGHSSPDGSHGDINPDTHTLTTALNIVKQITINIQ